jgi:hypothetical protein
MLSVVYKKADYSEDCCLAHSKLSQWLFVDKTFLSEGTDKLCASSVWNLNFQPASAGRWLSAPGLLNPSSARAIRLPVDMADELGAMIRQMQSHNIT